MRARRCQARPRGVLRAGASLTGACAKRSQLTLPCESRATQASGAASFTLRNSMRRASRASASISMSRRLPAQQRLRLCGGRLQREVAHRDLAGHDDPRWLRRLRSLGRQRVEERDAQFGVELARRQREVELHRRVADEGRQVEAVELQFDRGLARLGKGLGRRIELDRRAVEARAEPRLDLDLGVQPAASR